MISEKVAIYCRLSVEDMDKANGEDDSESIQNQKMLLIDYAINQGWNIYKVYSDDDYSGLDRNRPEFNKMISDAKNGLFNIVLCKTQSRFTRDMEMVEKYIHGLFVLLGIRFVSLVDNVDTTVKGNKKARQIYGLINEWYCEDLSDNIRAVFKKKMQDGQFLGSFAPYGYAKDPNDHHKLCIDEEAANVVKEIYSLYLKGFGYKYISDTLTSRHILTPTAYKKDKGLNFVNPNSHIYSENYGIWPTNSIRRILQNEVYIGYLIQGREKKVSYKSNKVIIAPKEEWIVVKNNHKSIIDKKDFYTVQNLIGSKRTVCRSKNKYGGTERAYILAGKLKCLYCGSNMQKAAPTRDGTTFYLRCSLANKTKGNACTPHSIKLSTITSIVETKIKEIINLFLGNKTEVDSLKDFFNNRDVSTNGIKVKKSEIKAIDIKKDEISKMLISAYIDKTKCIINEVEFINIKNVLNENITCLDKKKIFIEEEIEAYELKCKSINNVDLLLEKYTDFECLTNEIINDFVDNIQIGKDEIIINWLF